MNQQVHKLLKDAVSPELCAFISDQLRLAYTCKQYEYDQQRLIRQYVGAEENPYPFSQDTPNCFSEYCFNPLEVLMHQITPVVEETFNKRLYPSFSFGRIHFNGSILPRHFDRVGCEYAATMTLATDGTPWALMLDEEEHHMDVGDLFAFIGTKVNHGRDPYQGREHIQAAFFWVDADGEHTHKIFDGRPYLGWTGKKL